MEVSSSVESNNIIISKGEISKCHCCKNKTNEKKSIQCTKTKCSCVFCTNCFSEKYYSFSKSKFLKEKKSGKWICYKCKLVCNCNDCLNKLSNEQQNYLKLKRSRISKKLKKYQTPNHNGLESLSNVAVINRQFINKLKETKRNKKGSSNSVYNNYEIAKDFPNYQDNIILNQVICSAANESLSLGNKSNKKKSNKPCIRCTKFKCPLGIEIVKFKSYDEFNSFIIKLFSEVESRLNKQHKRGINQSNIEVSLNNSKLQLILNQKKHFDKIRENLKQSSDIKLKGPKRFCSNCISNLFREQNCLYTIYESLKDEDEQTLEFKKKLEIMNGIHQLIVKEGEFPKGGKIDPFLLEAHGDKKLKENNIFNEIFEGNKMKKDHEPNRDTTFSVLHNYDEIEMFDDSRKNQSQKIDNIDAIQNINISTNSNGNQNNNNLSNSINTSNQHNDVYNYNINHINNAHSIIFNSESLSNDQMFNSQRLNRSSQNIDELDNFYMRNFGNPQNNNSSTLNYGYGLNYSPENKMNILNINNSNSPVPGSLNTNIISSNSINLESIMNPYIINQYQNINTVNAAASLNEINNIFRFDPNIHSNPYYLNNQNAIANNYKKCFKKLELIINQLDFTIKQIENGRYQCEEYLSQYIESIEPNQKSYFKSKLDEIIISLQQRVLITNTLLKHYQNELTLNQVENNSFPPSISI